MTKKPVSLGAALGGQEIGGEQQHLLDLIDKLQYAQLDTSKLPRIVVVGDQSAGKSSVLEAVTGVPFPRASGACTRFATEIRLRRSKEEKLNVFIRPDAKRPSHERERLRQFGAAVNEDTSFEALMYQAVDLIAPRNIPGRFAAKDVLVVEKSGPNLPLLNCVDLPGLVRNANNDQSMDDIRAIEELTDMYMKSSRTIILAIVGGNTDYVQAPVLNKARQFDPKGNRTLGVLTKPDLTDSIGLEDKFIDLVQNRDSHNNFKLGWYVILNPGPRDEAAGSWTPEERAKKEAEFFGKGKWAALPNSMVGVSVLKQRLSLQLSRHIAKYIPVLRREIKQELDKTDAELKSLGAGKDTVEEMKTEMVKLASESKDLVTPAVDGTYKNPRGKSFFPRDVNAAGIPAQKLRARAVLENKRFAALVRDQGHKLTLVSMSDNYSPGNNRAMSKEEFAKKVVEPFLEQNTGTHFPKDHEPRVVYALFQYYSQNWPSLARDHKDNLGVMCNEFIAEIIEHIWPKHMHENLRAEFLDPQMSKIMSAAQKEVELLEQDQQYEVQPYDNEYEIRLEAWRRTADAEKPFSIAEELLEKMLIYYELSARTFTTNVITQIIERHLLQGLYDVFSPVKIDSLNNNTVETIAAESREIRDRRVNLRQKKKAIEESLEACANLAMRKELRAHMDDDELDEASEDDNMQSSLARKRVNGTTVAPAVPSSRPVRQQRQDDYYVYPESQTPQVQLPRRDSRESLRPSSSGTPYNPPPPPPRPEKVGQASSYLQQQQEEYYRQQQMAGYNNDAARQSQGYSYSGAQLQQQQQRPDESKRNSAKKPGGFFSGMTR